MGIVRIACSCLGEVENVNLSAENRISGKNYSICVGGKDWTLQKEKGYNKHPFKVVWIQETVNPISESIKC